jgi:hypothetical protein
MGEYWKTDFMRALHDTFLLYGEGKTMMLALTFIVTCFVKHHWDEAGASAKFAKDAAWGLLVSLVVGLIIFLCHLFVFSPAAIYADQKTKIGDLNTNIESLRAATNTLHSQLNAKPTPIRNNAMHLADALEEFLQKCAADNVPPNEISTKFNDDNYDHWIIDVHDELFKNNHHCDRFDGEVQKLNKGAFMLFNNRPDAPRNIIAGIRDDIKKLAGPIKE